VIVTGAPFASLKACTAIGSARAAIAAATIVNLIATPP
jgi:hypothetical protein